MFRTGHWILYQFTFVTCIYAKVDIRSFCRPNNFQQFHFYFVDHDELNQNKNIQDLKTICAIAGNEKETQI